ncbi:MAG: hypothetical protein FWG11_08025 [Promicromonosporaceae bacterium]|nr:hypothetical protein [Promicromonosporaceae bacterium]
MSATGPAGQAEAGTQTVSRAAERRVYRQAARDAALFLAGLAAVGAGLGAWLAGWPGVWGALLGAGFAAMFCAGTILAMAWTIDATPLAMSAAMMGAWLVKIIVLIAVLAFIRDMDFFSPQALFAVVALGAIGSALLDYRAVAAGRIPYIDAGRGRTR